MATVYKEHLKLPLNGQVESPVSILSCSFLFKEGLADVLAKVGTSTLIQRTVKALTSTPKEQEANTLVEAYQVQNGLSTDTIRSGSDIPPACARSPRALAPLPFPLPMLVPSRACTPCSPCSAPLPFPLPMYACPLLALCPCLRIINTYLFIYLLHSHLITK